MVRSGSVRRTAASSSPAAAAVPTAFTASPGDYRLLEEVGYGANAVVYRAVFLPSNRTVAVKCLDLDRVNSNLDDIRKEAQTMSLIDHPNVIRAYCSFVVDHNLWVIMPFMSEGSCLHLMKVAYPDGFEEPVIASILKETLKALEYLHRQGHIHRDVKRNIIQAGNILMDSPGIVKLGDFGVSACMFDRGDRQRSRNTFVGTPCWMAPEVLQPGAGYNFKKYVSNHLFTNLIWLFKISLRGKNSNYHKNTGNKVLLMTLQNAPPGLDYDRDKRFSKSFKEMVAMCLVKDQTKRPTAEKLLKHSFFKNAKPPELTVKSILTDLPPLWDRVKALQLKDAAQLALKKMPSSEQEALSMIHDDDPPEIKEDVDNDRINEADKEPFSGNHFGQPKILSGKHFRLNHEQTCVTAVSPGGNMHETSRGLVSEPGDADSERKVDGYRKQGEAAVKLASDKQKSCTKRTTNLSGPLALPTRASANSLSAPIRSSGGYVGSLGDKSKRSVVEIKGRFSVTSENVDLAKVQEVPTSGISRKLQEGSSLRKSASVGHWPVDAKPMDLITNLLSSLQQNEKADATQYRLGNMDGDTEVETSISEGERSLLVKIFELQSRMISLTDELITTKLQHVQLQEELKILYCHEEIIDTREVDNA
uniref:Ste20-related protein kinase n=1 Tax=Oryza sativa subsp. japonica TaxID=39947 RepID=Q8GZX1_ORYSJ|nr:Putative Ste20-related protein kinase [Oryza sativa Japonica Group]